MSTETGAITQRSLQLYRDIFNQNGMDSLSLNIFCKNLVVDENVLILHLCPEMTLIRCTLNFDIQHEVFLKV